MLVGLCKRYLLNKHFSVFIWGTPSNLLMNFRASKLPPKLQYNTLCQMNNAHCQFSGFSFTFISLVDFSKLPINFVLPTKKIVKRQDSRCEHCNFTKKKLSKKVCTPKIKVQKHLIAFYGAIVRGIVLKMSFRFLSREFESIETSPGFTQILGENWN